MQYSMAMQGAYYVTSDANLPRLIPNDLPLNGDYLVQPEIYALAQQCTTFTTTES